MQKFRCCDAANPKTHDDGKVGLTFQHGCQDGRIARSMGFPAHASNAVNLRVFHNRQITLAVGRGGNRDAQTQARERAKWIKCAKRLGFLELSYARIACGSISINEYKFIITSDETVPFEWCRGAGGACVTGHCLDETLREADHVRRCPGVRSHQPRGRPGSIASPAVVRVETKARLKCPAIIVVK